MWNILKVKYIKHDGMTVFMQADECNKHL